MTIDESQIIKKIKELSERLPRFPDGRINYTHADTALVITVFLQYEDKILLLKRSNKVGTYQGKWNTVTGYLDEPRPLIEKIKEELEEELGIKENIIKSYHLGKPFTFTDPRVQKTWIIHPAKVILKNKPEITLDWEHTEYCWIYPQEMKNYGTVPNLLLSLDRGLLTKE
jgi:8-oxo-dGTP pyrophosphatase MutT (NUDIX family)